MVDRVGQQIGNYRLVRLLGQGGFADVYLGEHIHLETRAAIKILHSRLAVNDIEQFRREARIVAQLEHPHIVHVFDFGVEDTTPYLIMSYAPNGTLRQRHPKETQLPLSLIVSYVKQIADALYYAHTQRLIHRDIKPENLLIGHKNEVLLSDFGIALVAQSSHYQSTKDLAGTIAYMAPEQIEPHPRPASDQYSLGIVVYEWLAGDKPFHGSFTEIAVKHSTTPPPSLREKIPTISPLVEQAVFKALAKEPEKRFATVQAFANALEQASSAPYPRVFVPQPTLPSPSPQIQTQAPTEIALSPGPSLPPDQPVALPGSSSPSAPPVPQLNRPPGGFADRAPLQYVPAEIQKLAIASHLGTSIAEYKVKPKIVTVNGYFLLIAVLCIPGLFALVTNMGNNSSLWLGIFLVGSIILACVFLGLHIWRIIHAYLRRSTRIYVYTNGIIHLRNSQTEVFQWNQIQAFWYRFSDHFFFGIHTGTSHLYAILLSNGKAYHFSDDFPNVEGLGNTITHEATRYLLPQAIASYNTGIPIAFGDIRISQRGISDSRKIVTWDQIENIQAFQNFIRVKTRNQNGSKTHVLTTNFKTIPNIPVFVALSEYVIAKNTASRGGT